MSNRALGVALKNVEPATRDSAGLRRGEMFDNYSQIFLAMLKLSKRIMFDIFESSTGAKTGLRSKVRHFVTLAFASLVPRFDIFGEPSCRTSVELLSNCVTVETHGSPYRVLGPRTDSSRTRSIQLRQRESLDFLCNSF